MAKSDAFQSYTMIMWILMIAMIAISACGAVIAIILRLGLMTKLTKSMLRATNNMQIAGRLLKRQRLDPPIIATIACERGGITENEICADYDKQFKKPVNLVGKVYGIDSVTKDFVKYFAAGVLKGEKGDKKEKKDKNKKKEK
uniref:Uncharacterized protein n=1 Tax=Caenorhabditis japonica TaxID=281687 RepID=A0A8R1DLL8_CAEJA